MSITWPKEMAQFVGYDAAARRASLHGSTVTMRSQVYVRFYQAIQVASVAVGGQRGVREGEDPETAYVTFSGASVGLEYDFGAAIRPEDPGCAVLQDAARTHTPVTVALETIRRARSKAGERQPISPLTPIHALRGAGANGGGGNPQVAKAHTKNLVVMVAGDPTSEITSDPTEWATLTDNRGGTLAPDGWTTCRAGDDGDWTAYGVIVPASAADGPTGAPQVTDDSLRATIRDAVRDALAEARPGPVKSSRQAPTSNDRPSAEGTPYQLYNGDGRLNLGSTLLSKYRIATERAHRLLDRSGRPVTDPADPALWALTTCLLDMADRVQVAVHGAGSRPDRMAKSHHEAIEWLAWTVDTFYPVPADPAATTAWAAKVERAARRLYAQAAAAAAAYIGDDPAPGQIRALLDRVEDSWDDPDALRAVLASTRAAALLDAPVAAITGAGTAVSLVGGAPGTSSRLGQIIIDRGRALTGHTSEPASR